MINQSNQQADKQQHADGEEVHFCGHTYAVNINIDIFFPVTWEEK